MQDEITVHESSSSRDSSKANTESSLEASKDDRVEIDIAELKDHLGLKDIVSSIEEMKALFHKVVGKQNLEASEPNTSKKTRTEEASKWSLVLCTKGMKNRFFRRFSTIQRSVDPNSQRSLPLESTRPVQKRLWS